MGIEKNPYFIANFTQKYEISKEDFIVEEGEIIFNFKEGIRFNYFGKEEKQFVIFSDGYYFKEKEAEWSFYPWDLNSKEYKFFMLLIKGEVEENEELEISEKKGILIIKSKNPNFEILIDKKNYFPLEFNLKDQSSGLNHFEFKKHKKILKKIMP